MDPDRGESICPGCRGNRSQLRWRLGDRLFRTTDKQFGIQECPDCSLLFLWPVPPADELAGYYPSGYWAGDPHVTGDPSVNGTGLHRRVTEAYRRFMLRDHVRFVRGAIAGQRRLGKSEVDLLDVGCGDGSFLAALGHRPCAGLDLSEGGVRACLSRGLEAHRGSPEENPFAATDRRFDVVTMFHFLEHVPAPDTTLAHVRPMLKPDGQLIVQVPNCASLQARWLGEFWTGYDVPRHLVNYSPATLEAVLERSGFGVVEVSFQSLRDNPVLLASSIAPALYPPAAVARQGGRLHRQWRGWVGDVAFLGLTLASVPATWLEARFGRGAAVTVRAEVRT